MTTTTSAAAPKILSARVGTNPKTLHRKAMEKAAAAPKDRDGEGLEELFPAPASPVADHTTSSGRKPAFDGAEQPASDTAVSETASAFEPAAAPTVDITESSASPAQANQAAASPPSTTVEDRPAPVAPGQPDASPSWTEADERAYQAMLARRKGAGFQRRGRDVSAQRVKAGAVTPNAGTVVADIVGLVAERGTIGRGELLDLMATAAFAHPKGKGGDRAWSQGYVSGAIASGFLALSDDGDALGEVSPDASAAAA